MLIDRETKARIMERFRNGQLTKEDMKLLFNTYKSFRGGKLRKKKSKR